MMLAMSSRVILRVSVSTVTDVNLCPVPSRVLTVSLRLAFGTSDALGRRCDTGHHLQVERGALPRICSGRREEYESSTLQTNRL
jgi:hypothetical protein